MPAGPAAECRHGIALTLCESAPLQNWKSSDCPMMRYCTFSLALIFWIAAATAFADDEICASCGYQVSVSGSFSHHKDRTNTVIEAAGENAAAFREDVSGTNFTITISHLPAGRYTIIIEAAETVAFAPG